MIKRLAMLAAAALALGGPGAGAQDGLALMKVEPGARPAGMGGAFAAMLGSADAVPYNPAAGHVAEALAVSLGHVSYWERIRLESGFLTALVRPKLSVHAAVRYASVDDLERRTAPTTEPEGRFDAQDMSLKAGAAYEATERVTVGASFGWFMEKIDQANGWAFAADLGATVRVRPDLTFGAAVTGLGSDLTLQVAGEDASRPISLPTTWRVGGAYVYDRVAGAADFVYLDDAAHGHFGVEVRAHELLQFRTGYMAGYDSKGFTAGASFVQRNVTIDYAFVPYRNDLGTTHMFNLRLTL